MGLQPLEVSDSVLQTGPAGMGVGGRGMFACYAIRSFSGFLKSLAGHAHYRLFNQTEAAGSMALQSEVN